MKKVTHKTHNKEELRKYFLFGVIFLLLFLSFKIVQPYLIVIISSFVLAYLVRPLYVKLNQTLGKTFSAILCILLVLVVILLPFAGIVGGITNQAYNLISNQNISTILDKVESLPILTSFNLNLDSLLEKVALIIIHLVSSALSYIPTLAVSLLVLIFGMYYILIDYDRLSVELKNYLPFQDKHNVAKQIDVSTKGIIYGSLLIAIIEFAVSVVGFYISGVNSYLLLPIIVFFFAFIPGLGPTIVWVPLALFYAFTHNVFATVGVLITGLILSLYVDTVLRAKILGSKSRIHPFVMLVGILGGISFFGIFGFVIGPLILIYSIKILREYLSGEGYL